MGIKARKLKDPTNTEKGSLYEVTCNCEIAIEEKQDDGSLDRVILEYDLKDGDVAYFAKEYLPNGRKKEGEKRIDITAVMVNHTQKCVRWHLYDMKGELAWKKTIVKLYSQWNAGLCYLKQSILCELSGYEVQPDLGVLARNYNKTLMERIRQETQSMCDEFERHANSLPLSMRKKKLDIAKDRAILEACNAILQGVFHGENEFEKYVIHIKYLQQGKDDIFQTKLSV